MWDETIADFGGEEENVLQALTVLRTTNGLDSKALPSNVPLKQITCGYRQ